MPNNDSVYLICYKKNTGIIYRALRLEAKYLPILSGVQRIFL